MIHNGNLITSEYFMIYSIMAIELIRLTISHECLRTPTIVRNENSPNYLFVQIT